MTQRLRLILLILGLYSTCFWGLESALGDGLPPMPPMPHYKEVLVRYSMQDVLFYFIFFVPTVFLATVGVEYPVVYLLLGRPAKARKQLLYYCALVNVITNPAAQLCAFFIADTELLGSASLAHKVEWIIEFVVVIVEFELMIWIFGRMWRDGILDEPVSAGRVLVISVAANIASYVTVYMGFVQVM